MSTQNYLVTKNAYTAIAGPGTLIANITVDRPAQIVFSPTTPNSILVGHHLEINEGISISSMGVGIIAWAKSELNSASVMVTLGTDATVTTGASGNGGGDVVGGPGSLTFENNGSVIGTAPTFNVLSSKASIDVSGSLATLTINVASNLDIEANGIDQGNATALNFTGAGASIGVSNNVATFNVPGSSLSLSDEGVSKGTATSINVTGLGGSTNVVGSGGTINVPGLTISDEGVSQGSSASINFIGSGVSSDVSAGNSTVIIPGGQNVADTYLSPSGGDDAPAIWHAYQHLYNNGGGTIHLDAGFFRLNTAPGGNYSCIGMIQNHPGMITIKGRGKSATTLVCSSACHCLVSLNVGGSGGMYRLLTIEDMLINSSYIVPQGGSVNGLIIDMYNTSNVQDIFIRRVDTKNMHKQKEYPFKSSVSIINYQFGYGTDGLPAGGTKYVVERILVEDCNFCINNDLNGYGGNYGVQIGSSVQNNTSQYRPGARATCGFDDWTSNQEYNDITINRCKWDSGSFPLVGGTAPSTGFLVGSAGHGARWQLYDCYAARSGDDNFELGSGTSIAMVNCISDTGHYEGFFFSNQGGMPSNQSQVTIVKNCRALTSYFIDGVTAPSQSPLLVTGGGCFGYTYGHFILEDFEGPCSFVDRIQAVTIDNYTCRGHQPARSLKALSNGYSLYAGGGISFNLNDAKIDISINNVNINDYDTFNYNGHTGNQVLSGVPGGILNLQIMNYANIKINDVNIFSNLSPVAGNSGTGTVRFHPISLFYAGTNTGSQSTDAFTTNYFLSPNSYVCDTNNVNDISVSGGAVICVSNPLVEKRFVWMGNFNTYGAGPFVDSGLWIGCIPTTNVTIPVGHKTGIILKRSDISTKLGGALNYIDCYVTDDGTNTKLNIDVILGGTRTNRATLTSGTRLSSATKYWVMAIVRGNQITLTYRSSAPFNILSQTGIISTLTYTLTGLAEIYTLGADQIGWGGFSWIPGDSTSKLYTIVREALAVYNGYGFDNVTIKAHDAVNDCVAVTYADPANMSSWVRFNNTMNMTNFNLSGLSGTTAINETAGLTSAYTKNIRKSGQWITNTAPAAISVTASPFTYTNTDACNEDIAIYGGIISSITLSRDKGASFGQVAAVGYSVFNAILNPGDIVVVTYSVAPTMKKVPIF